MKQAQIKIQIVLLKYQNKLRRNKSSQGATNKEERSSCFAQKRIYYLTGNQMNRPKNQMKTRKIMVGPNFGLAWLGTRRGQLNHLTYDVQNPPPNGQIIRAYWLPWCGFPPVMVMATKCYITWRITCMITWQSSCDSNLRWWPDRPITVDKHPWPVSSMWDSNRVEIHWVEILVPPLPPPEKWMWTYVKWLSYPRLMKVDQDQNITKKTNQPKKAPPISFTNGKTSKNCQKWLF